MNASSLETQSRPAADETVMQAPLQEVFSSIQGEGIYVGQRQIFVRFAHCHLKCAYCDTPMTTADGKCHIETTPGGGPSAVQRLDNPVPLAALLSALDALIPQARHHSISFTGGEPLLYHRYLAALFPQIRQRGLKTYLETSGTQADFLETVLPHTDIVAMDIKLPSSTHEAPQFENHRGFYNAVRQRAATELFIKLIFNDDTHPAELDAVADIVTDRAVPIILQPETSLSDKKIRVSPSKIFQIEHYLSQTFTDVRVIPQTHKMMSVL